MVFSNRASDAALIIRRRFLNGPCQPSGLGELLAEPGDLLLSGTGGGDRLGEGIEKRESGAVQNS